MSKGVIHGKTGKIINNRKRFGDILADSNLRMQRRRELAINPPKPTPGIRTIVMEAYKKGGIEAAYTAARMANERLKQEVYTEQIVDLWIREENEKTR